MALRRSSRILVTLAGLIAVVVIAAACAPAPPPSPPAAQDMVVRHNYVRALNGIAGLWTDGHLQQNAQFHADRLGAGLPDCSRLWHSPEMADWYRGHGWGENLACVPGCPSDAGQALGMWMNSPGHARNVFHPGFGLIGVGTSCNGSVQMVVAHYRSP